MPTSISTPDPYAGNPIIDLAEQALRAFDENLSLADATKMLPMWARAAELTARERAAILSRFATPSHTPDSVKAFWAHTPASTSKATHAFTVERTAGEYYSYIWRCRCGEVIVQDPADLDFGFELIEHAGVAA